MTVFRSNGRPNDAENNRFAEPAPSRADSVDLLNKEPPEAPRAPMPSFTAERETPRNLATEADKCANVIAAGSKWNGSLNIDDSVRIDGQLSGEIVAKGTVHIADGARVDAKIRAAFVVVSGTFKGEIRASERLELMPRSRVEGQLLTKALNVHEGAIVDGSIQMTSDREAARTAKDSGDAEPTPVRSRATSA